MVRRPIALALGFALVLAACGGDESTSTATTSSGAAAPAATTLAPAADAPATTAAPAAGSAATTAATADVIEPLRVVAPLVTGGTSDLSAFATRPTVFWFWAPG
jgi:hypothetical protein